MVSGVGSVRLITSLDKCEGEVTLTRVYYAAGFTKNLISVSRIDESGYNICVFNGKMTVYKSEILKPVMLAKRESRLYKFLGRVDTPSVTKSVPSYSQVTKLGPNTNSKVNSVNLGISQVNSECVIEGQVPHEHKFSLALSSVVRSTRNASKLQVWHKRFAHQNIADIKLMLKDENVLNFEISDKTEFICQPCRLAKSTRASLKPLSDIKSSAPLDLVFMDLCGPFRVQSIGGSRYFLTITDDYSRFVHIYPLKTKDESFRFFKSFCNEMKTRYNQMPKSTRSDNGGEFTSKEFKNFCELNGIAMQFTNAYTPEQNGVSERLNRTINSAIRSVLVETHLPEGLWAELAMSFIHLKNRFPHSALKGQIPYVLWNEQKFSVAYLRSIGSKCYVHFSEPGRNKYKARAWEGVLVGYARATRGYRVWNPLTNKVFESKHVTVDETCMWGQPNFTSNKILNVKNFAQFDLSKELFNENLTPNAIVTPTLTRTSTVPLVVTPLVPNISISPAPILNLPVTPVNPRITLRGRRVPAVSLSDQQRTSPITVRLKDVIDNWGRTEITRKTGATMGRNDVYYYPPGVKPGLRSKPDVMRYCRANGILYDSSCVHFGTQSLSVDDQLENPRIEDPIVPQIEDNTELISESTDDEDEVFEDSQEFDDTPKFDTTVDETILLSVRRDYPDLDVESVIYDEEGNLAILDTSGNTTYIDARPGVEAHLIVEEMSEPIGVQKDEVLVGSSKLEDEIPSEWLSEVRADFPAMNIKTISYDDKGGLTIIESSGKVTFIEGCIG